MTIFSLMYLSVILLLVFSICIHPTLSTSSLSSRPSILRVEHSPDSKLVHVFWLPPEASYGEITGYDILYTDDNSLRDNKWKREKVFGQKTTTVLTKLNPDTTYFLKIKPIIDDTEFGPPSDIIEFITKSSRISSLSKPKILYVVTGEDSSVAEITWQAPEEPMGRIKRYEIYYTRGEAKQNAKWKVEIVEKVRDFDDINVKKIYGLLPDTNYKFIVKVKTSEDNVGLSSSVFEYETGPLVRKNKDYTFDKVPIYTYRVHWFLSLFSPLVLIFFIYFICFKLPQGDKEKEAERREREAEQQRTTNYYYIKRRKHAELLMLAGRFEEAVREYELIYYMDPSIENKRLLENAKKKLAYCKILGVRSTAGPEEIRKAYKELALKHHPDKHANASEIEKKKHEKAMKDINEAYNVLIQ